MEPVRAYILKKFMLMPQIFQPKISEKQLDDVHKYMQQHIFLSDEETQCHFAILSCTAFVYLCTVQ